MSMMARGIENGLAKFSHTGFAKGMVNAGMKNSKSLDALGQPISCFMKNAKKHTPAAQGAVIGGFYLYNTLKADIPKERKQTLALNCLITTLIGVTGGYTINSWIGSKAGKLVDSIEKSFKKDVGKTISKSGLAAIKTGAKAAIPLACFSLTFRFVSPVLATPLADVATKAITKIKELNKGKQLDTQKPVNEQKLNVLK